MRCLALARALKVVGAEVLFVCRDYPGHLNDYLVEQGFTVARLPVDSGTPRPNTNALSRRDHSGSIETSQEVDAMLTTGAIENSGKADWLVVDHYALEGRFEAAVRPVTRCVMVVDDLADRQHQCDLLLDPNDYPDRDHRYDLLVPKTCHRLLGPAYALLRPEFLAERATLPKRAGSVRRILIFFGGGDPGNETKKALNAFLALGRSDIDLDVVVGAANRHRGEIARICAAHSNLHYFCQLPNIARLMAAADLAVGGGGVALLERCALSLPSIVLSLAANQLAGCKALARRGGAFFLGEASTTSASQITGALELALGAPDLLQHMAQQAGVVTDGRGASRVAAHMHEQPLSLRRAMPDDCEPVWRWRNDTTVRQFSHNPRGIELPEHRRWYAAALTDPNRVLLIGENRQGLVGLLRYDIAGQLATISVYLVPERRGVGLGTRLIQEGEAWLREHRQEVAKICAEIVERNDSSIRAFTKAGFVPDHTVYIRQLRGG